VIGVEMNQQAVEDARANAEENGIDDVEFVCGRAEDVLQKQLEECGPGSGEVIGVVDPPRAGLHPRVVQCIRKCSHIQKLVYVSCNPEGHTTLGNFVDLCRRPSLRVKGTPFSPVMAVPVDLFPHTPHCELVILFQRHSSSHQSQL
jgi:tRNA (uracil-5-)-methyltransferase